VTRFILSPHPQGTPEWKQDRAGKATGSPAGCILAKIKSGEAAERRNYRVQLVTERLTQAPQDDSFVSKDMQWGTEQEPYGRMAFEAATGEIVREAGFAYLPNLAAGCSVDGFIGTDGILEIKCPKSATHIKYLLAAKLPPEYEAQVTHNLFITGATFCEFVSFDPRLPDNLQLFRVRVMREELDMEGYESELRKFLAEVDALEAKLRKGVGRPIFAEAA
jgi:predicted phage-related endonuclease